MGYKGYSSLIITTHFCFDFHCRKISDVLPNGNKIMMHPKFLLYVMEQFLGKVQKGAKEKWDVSHEVP
jgi:hypothetical protein